MVRFSRINRLMWISALLTGAFSLTGYGNLSDKVKPKEVQIKNIVTTQTLNGQWKLSVDPENKGRDEGWFNGIRPESKEAVVPGVIQQVFPGYHGVAWYWHTFTPDFSKAPGDRVLIRFGAVDYLADVWINGNHAGSFEGGETPFEFDITNLLKTGSDNLLAVRVLNPTNNPIDGYILKQTPGRNKTMPARPGSAFNSGGIMYPVELRLVPATYITDVFVRPDSKTGNIGVTIAVRNAGTSSTTGTLDLSVTQANSGDLLQAVEQQAVFPVGVSEHELTIHVARPRLWNLDDPFLYRVTANLISASKQTHQQSVRCGFRDFRIVDGFFQLNGKRVFLKSTHTGNCMPVGQQVSIVGDFGRRDMLYAKASGFNAVRFISGVAFPEQLDLCDELGLMVYEECFAAWCLENSPRMPERFDHNTSSMIRRDRNHASITIWGLLNETAEGPVFQQAVNFLPKLRNLDTTRLVLLSSGRWDGQWATGSASNPGSNKWEHIWGVESLNAEKSALGAGGYVGKTGDAHFYPKTPQSFQTDHFLRTMGRDTKPVFLSEYGIGSQTNVINEWRHFGEAGARPDLEDAASYREQSEAFVADWKRLGFENVYPFPEDMLRESMRLHARQRTIGFNCIRSNPQFCGYNLTGMLDHAMTGEGLWTFFREWKPSTFDAVSDGWSPLRWCLFVEPLHVYSGRRVTVEAVLANEDVIKPGAYRARFRVFGPQGSVWEKESVVKVPNPPVLAVPAIRETFELNGPAGQYSFAANMEEGGAPTGGRLAFYVSDSTTLPKCKGKVALWGIDKKAEQWLIAHGLDCQQLTTGISNKGEVILVGKPADAETNPKMWESLSARMAKGSTVVFLSGQIFKKDNAGIKWLPLKNKGICRTFDDWLYHKECVAKRHQVFDGLQGPSIMDWDYYGPVIPHEIFEGQDTPDETIAAAFATGNGTYSRGYGSGLLIAMYKIGKGEMILSTPYVLENLNSHPAADRLLLNLVSYAQVSVLNSGMKFSSFSEKPDTTATSGEMKTKSNWVKEHLTHTNPQLPFSFLYDGKASSGLLKTWQKKTETNKIDKKRTQYIHIWKDNKTGLEVRCVSVEYSDYPAIEWTVYLKNTGKNNTPILKEIQGLDAVFKRGNSGEFILNGIKGDFCTADSYEPYQLTLGPNDVKTFAPRSSGKSCDGPDGWPYYNLQVPGGGLILAVGWPGQWASSFTRDNSNDLVIKAGQQLTNLYLKPGEEIRTPLIAMLFWEGKETVPAQNLWRRFYLAHIIPRIEDIPQPSVMQIQIGGAIKDTSYVNTFLQAGIKPDICWRDAGGGENTWYPSNNGPYKGNDAWLNTGTWEIDPGRYPNGFKPFTDWIHQKGMKFVLWFEPERVGDPNSWLSKNHPEWLLPGTSHGALLNEGNPEALNWLINHVDGMIKSQGIDWYREDMNGGGPLPAWKKNEAKDRQGITENLYVQGHLAFWDELKRRNPQLRIDACASGGRRNDLETMRRAVPLLRSDFQWESMKDVIEGNQGQTYGLSSWLPFQGTGVYFYDAYAYRSFYMSGFGMGGLSPENKVAQRQAYSECREIAPAFLFGDYYPLTPYSLQHEHWIAWQFNQAEKDNGFIQAFRRDKCEEATKTFRLSGLNPDAQYEIKDFDLKGSTLVTGKILMENGLAIEIKDKPGAALIKYEKVKSYK